MWWAIDEKAELLTGGIWQQQALIFFEDKLSNRSHLAVGALGEQWVCKTLDTCGYDVATVGNQPRRGDLVAINRATGETWQVEVKTARRGADGCYRWNLVKDDKHGHTDCNDADVLVLLAVEGSGKPVVFVVPVADVGERKTLQIRGDARAYEGQWARYRQTRKIELEVANDDHV
jgi:hypothetical protein